MLTTLQGAFTSSAISNDTLLQVCEQVIDTTYKHFSDGILSQSDLDSLGELVYALQEAYRKRNPQDAHPVLEMRMPRKPGEDFFDADE